MLGTNWKTSERKYDVRPEHDIKIPMSDGILLDGDVFRPESEDRFPAILGMSPYPKDPQTAPILPDTFSASFNVLTSEITHNGHLESGDPNFYVRRGYAHVVVNARGTGKSEGDYPLLGPREAKDAYEVIEWLAKQPWCDGNVGMFGVSYFAMIQWAAAALKPPHLKCIFAPWGTTDLYREMFYHGGILSATWSTMWPKNSMDWPKQRADQKLKSVTLEKVGEKRFNELVSAALMDEDISSVSTLFEALKHPNSSFHPFIVDIILHPFYDDYWKERTVNYEGINIPCYIGTDWAPRGMHLQACFKSWKSVKAPKKMLVGPPAYTDRPLYQLHYESLRWFDYWLKGVDTHIMDEPPISLYIPGTGEWKQASEWPLPETKWTPFYLHEHGLLFEHEIWPKEGYETIFDSPWKRGSLEFKTPQIVENTEIIGHSVLNLFGSTTDREVLWIITAYEVDTEGNQRLISRGWLRGTHNEVNPELSAPWLPYHPHTRSVPLEPNKVYEFKIALLPLAVFLKVGMRLALKISCSDDAPHTPMETVATGHIARQKASRVTIYHDEEHPSHLLLPITKGNRLGTFISGGKPYI